jgi:hypothetical protein
MSGKGILSEYHRRVGMYGMKETRSYRLSLMVIDAFKKLTNCLVIYRLSKSDAQGYKITSATVGGDGGAPPPPRGN